VAAGLLVDIGATVVMANDGQEALERLAQGCFDCVLMDVQMPVMDGLQATRAIRANPLLADLPVLAMTANARSEDRARCLEAGMNDFLTKPVLPDRLHAALAHWLTPRGSAAPGAASNGPAQSLPSTPSAAAEPAAGLETSTPRAGSDPEVVDLSILSRQVGGDVQKVRRYGQLFVNGLPESLAELEAALGQGNLPMLADLGHRMKSSARMVGALGMATLCESLEGFRQGGTLGDAQVIVRKIPQLASRISADISLALP
jgi:CheY-like chemotaxis protein/HPt (histidine-containing phosphotransfer) domain-containing protein